jgi:hypothetical protein
LAGNITVQTQSIIATADKVLYVVADEVTGSFLESLNSTAESIYRCYDETVDRLDTYYRMANYIMEFVRRGKRTCAAFYGHPGICVFPAHEALLIARSEGFPAEMKAAVSAEDCLFADLGIDPGRVGCQSFAVTDFLVYGRKFDPNSVLVLWQVGVIGQVGFRKRFPIEKNISILIEQLALTYPRAHKVIIYEASVYPVCLPKIMSTDLESLDYRELSPISTLVIPPITNSEPNIDVVRRLGIPESYIKKRADNPARYNPLVPGVLS